MAEIVKKKEQINATVSPWIKKRCLELAETPEFSSISDVVSQALSEFFGKYDYIKTKESKEREDRIPDLLDALMKTKEGQEWLKCVFKTGKQLESGQPTEKIKNTQNPRKKEEEKDEEEEEVVEEEFILG